MNVKLNDTAMHLLGLFYVKDHIHKLDNQALDKPQRMTDKRNIFLRMTGKQFGLGHIKLKSKSCRLVCVWKILNKVVVAIVDL